MGESEGCSREAWIAEAEERLEEAMDGGLLLLLLPPPPLTTSKATVCAALSSVTPLRLRVATTAGMSDALSRRDRVVESKWGVEEGGA